MIEWKMRMVANCMRRSRSLCACPKQTKEERTRGRQRQHKVHAARDGTNGGTMHENKGRKGRRRMSVCARPKT